MQTRCNLNGFRQRIMKRRRNRNKNRNGRQKRGDLKANSGRVNKNFTVKCLEACKSVTVGAENHKDAARKSGLAISGVILQWTG